MTVLPALNRQFTFQPGPLQTRLMTSAGELNLCAADSRASPRRSGADYRVTVVSLTGQAQPFQACRQPTPKASFLPAPVAQHL